MSDSTNEILEDKAKKHEVGIAAMLQITNSMYFYEPTDMVLNCTRCHNRADFVERMKFDTHYHDAICITCRDKHVTKRFKNYLLRKQPDQRRYTITTDQARQKDFVKRNH